MGESNIGRRISVHQALGGGSVADVLLWKRWGGALLTLGSATILWFLFERAGYNLLSFVSNVLLLLVVILFVWAKSATLLNRPLPPIPNLEISEDTIAKGSGVTRLYINYALSIAHDITIKRNLKLFLQVAICLWLGSYIGGLCNFLTMVYVGVLLSFSLPVFYEKYQDWVDQRLCIAQRFIQTQYRKIDDAILKKLPVPSNNEKKTQ